MYSSWLEPYVGACSSCGWVNAHFVLISDHCRTWTLVLDTSVFLVTFQQELLNAAEGMPTYCVRESCTKYASYGVEGSGRGEFCAGHAEEGMVNVVTTRCAHAGCSTTPSFGVKGSTKKEFCSRHARKGMINVGVKRCAHKGCLKVPSFGVKCSNKADFCVRHAEVGMVNVVSKKCAHQDCFKMPSFGVAGSKELKFCARHATEGMVNVVYAKKFPDVGCSTTALRLVGVEDDSINGFCARSAEAGIDNAGSNRCSRRGCFKTPSFGVNGTSKEFCDQHVPEEMINVVNNRCARPGCVKLPSFGVKGSMKKEFCARHAKAGMVNVRAKRCAHQGCVTIPSFGMEGTKKAQFCARHAEAGMVNVFIKRCAHQDCLRKATFGVEGSNKEELCAQHAQEGMVNIFYKKRGHGHSRTSSSGVEVGKKAEVRDRNAVDGMLMVEGKSVVSQGCSEQISDGVNSDGKVEPGAETALLAKVKLESEHLAGIGGNSVKKHGCTPETGYHDVPLVDMNRKRNTRSASLRPTTAIDSAGVATKRVRRSLQ